MELLPASESKSQACDNAEDGITGNLLAGFVETSTEQQRLVEGVVFPLCLQPLGQADILDKISSQREILDILLRKYKAILFRNCNFSTAEDFHGFIEATGLNGMDYVGGAAVRTQLTSRVFTANESPSSENIPFHHEMAQTPDPPTHLLFFCEVEPLIGGETPLLVSSEMYDRIYAKQPAFMEDIERYGVKYIRYLPENDDPTSAIGRGWKSTYLCTSKEEAEIALVKLGSEWEWQPDGTLKTITAVVPGIRIDQGYNRSNRKTFFNSIVAAYTGWNDSRNNGKRAVVLATEGPEEQNYLNEEAISDALDIMNEIRVSIPWRVGDVMLVDNRTVMHSRKPYEGPRRVLASLVRDGGR